MLNQKTKSLISDALSAGYKTAYVCGAISKVGAENAKKIFNSFSEEIQKLGMNTLSTFTGCHPQNRKKTVYERKGVEIMMQCDIVIAMDNYYISDGARKQIKIAELMGIPVIKVR